MAGGSARLQQEIRGGNLTRVTTATFKDAFTGTQAVLDVEGGQVTVDITATNRRMLDLQLVPKQSTFDMLSVPGGEITVTQTLRYIDGTSETVPLGVFCINSQSMTYRPDGQLSLTCPDRWWRIQSNGFQLARASVSSNAGWQEIKRLVEGAWPNAAWPFPGWSQLDTSATTKVGPLVWLDGDRNNAIRSLLKLNSLDCYFDANGLAVLRPIPTLTSSSASAWTVNPGPAGVLMDAARARDLSGVHNVICVSTTASDVILPIQIVANTHAYATDQLSSLGPLGAVTLELQDNYRSTAQMIAAGKVKLSEQLSVQVQMDLTSFPNPALDGWDVISVVLPKGDSGSVTPAEQHLIQRVTHPLGVDAPQQLTMRAPRSTADDSV